MNALKISGVTLATLREERVLNYAQQILRHCVRDSSKLKGTSGLLSFRAKESVTELFIGTLKSGIDTVWTCQYVQDGFFVGSSSLRYVLGVRSVDAQAEWKQMQSCSAEFTASLQDVCVNSIKDFTLSSSHAFQTCCRRMRVEPDKKFRCDGQLFRRGSDTSVRNAF